jgi:ferric-dicitrate binding protein FerR (iron transport regulator)
MENFDGHTDALIARHFAGETMPEEDAALQSWVAESPENLRYFADLQAIWEKSPGMRPQAARPVNTEASLQKVKTRLRGGGKRRSMTAPAVMLWRAAAAVALAVAAVYFLWLRNAPAPATVIAAADAALTDTLTDGSVVTLSRQSGLAIAKGFNIRERRLRLHGEAYFKVQPDTLRPFVVEVQDLEVRVVGTAFQVDDAADADSVSVTVTEGKVRVSARGQALLLQAGESALYNKKSGALARLNTTQNPVMENKVLRFDATPLREVIRQIENMYGVKIILKNKGLEDCVLHARYNNLPPEEVLNLIAESFSLQLSRTEKGEFVLDGAGCGE